MRITARPIKAEGEWLQWRKSNVGASEVAAVFGLHDYKTRLELWAEKCGLIDPPAMTSVMARGKIMESAVAAAVALERPDWVLTKCATYFETDGRLAASPDYFIEGDSRGPGLLQCKTASPIAFKDQFGGDRPPLWIVLQTATETMLADRAFAACAVLRIDAWLWPEVRIFDIPRDKSAEDRIVAGVAEFWRSVEAGVQPAADYTRDRDLLTRLNPEQAPGMEIDLSGSNRFPELFEERRLAMRSINDMRSRCDSIEAELMDAMRHHERATFADGWRATWKVEPRKAHFVADSSPRVLRITKRSQ